MSGQPKGYNKEAYSSGIATTNVSKITELQTQLDAMTLENLALKAKVEELEAKLAQAAALRSPRAVLNSARVIDNVVNGEN